MNFKRAQLWLFVFVVGLGFSGWAKGAEASKVLVLNLSGTIDKYDPIQAATAFVGGSGASVVPQSEVEKFLSDPKNSRLAGCKSVECLSELGRAFGVKYVLSLRFIKTAKTGVRIIGIVIDPVKERIVARKEAKSPSRDETAINTQLQIVIEDLSDTWAALAEIEEEAAPSPYQSRAQPAESKASIKSKPKPVESTSPEKPVQPTPHESAQTKETLPAEPKPKSEVAEPEPTQPAEQTPTAQEEPTESAPAEEPAIAKSAPESEPPKEEEVSSAAKLKWRGELTTIGPLDVVLDRNRVGIAVGYRRIYAIHYAYVAPVFDIHLFKDLFAFSFEIPLNFEIFDSRIDIDAATSGEEIGFANAGRLRPEDWDEWRDYFKVIHYIRYGHKEDKLYLNINRDQANTLGHGFLLRRYIPSHEISHYKVSAAFDAYGEYLGFQAYTNDITSCDISGALVFIKPLAFFADNYIARSLSIGYTIVLDRDAPIYLDPGDVDSHGRFIPLDQGLVLGQGVDAELKVYRGDVLDIKFYTDFSKLMPFTGSDPDKHDAQILDSYPELFPDWRTRDFSGGWGYTFGTLWRMSWGSEEHTQAIRLRAEFRYFTDNYSPSYFDALYELQKWKYISETYPARGDVSEEMEGKIVPTKFVEVFSRNGDPHYGGMFEFSYAIKKIFGFTLATETATGTDQSKFLAHVEVPALSFLRLAATYYKWSFTDWSRLFNLDDSNAILITAARIHPLPLLYFNVGLRKTLKPSDKRISRMDNAFDLRIDVEFSWEWDAD